ncbi:MAG: ADP-ribosylglycohydrolase family protein [Caldilineaceae bacterium]
MTRAKRMTGALLGLAVGDAVGTTVEFKPRGTFTPVTDMVGGGPFRLPAGAWTDDTSLALCLATSLHECGGFDADDQMQRYVRWWQEGYLSSIGRCFDIGSTTSGRSPATCVPAIPSAAVLTSAVQATAPSCGSRLCRSTSTTILRRRSTTAAKARARPTAVECVGTCRLFGAMLWHAINGATKEAILVGATELGPLSPKIQAIADGEYRDKPVGAIRGSGYVVDSLEAALWCFHSTETYRDAILAAVNLGDGADTTAAVCGQIAGDYGEDSIPRPWLERLVMRAEIAALARVDA